MTGEHSGYFLVPDEIELLEFFGSEPVERSVDDGYWCYEIADRQGVRLRLSFNLYERSVQTEMLIGPTTACVVSHEGAVRMTITGGTLHCEFHGVNRGTTLAVALGERLRVTWATLQTMSN
jgi:hypothetical protein